MNDKVESKERTLSYEYYYLKTENFGKVDFEKLVNSGNNFHTATIKEADAGDASKTKLKYDKLVDANGGELCVGTRFVLGLIVKDYNGKEIHKERVDFKVMVPQADVRAESNLSISIPGDHALGLLPDGVEKFTLLDNGKRTSYVTKGKVGGRGHLDFGEFGVTPDVVLK